ncbi:MAG TPA: hypothetical protein VJ697_04145 [Nitrososphaeraceae archaeon]|nr:hypothetical protein [Nitrososphaeraceae archaeon]
MMIEYAFLRKHWFNGINLSATKAGLLNRGIIIQLEIISLKRRRK